MSTVSGDRREQQYKSSDNTHSYKYVLLQKNCHEIDDQIKIKIVLIKQ